VRVNLRLIHDAGRWHCHTEIGCSDPNAYVHLYSTEFMVSCIWKYLFIPNYIVLCNQNGIFHTFHMTCTPCILDSYVRWSLLMSLKKSAEIGSDLPSVNAADQQLARDLLHQLAREIPSAPLQLVPRAYIRTTTTIFTIDQLPWKILEVFRAEHAPKFQLSNRLLLPNIRQRVGMLSTVEQECAPNLFLVLTYVHY